MLKAPILLTAATTSRATQMRATLVRGFRRSTARMGLRLLPDFIIIGTQRGGTTSLFKLLSEHPCVGMPYRKEVHYFDNQFDQPLNWYQSYFPTTVRRSMLTSRSGAYVTGEASPYYMYHPHAPERVSQTLPEVKVIMMLRNPIDRAFSHYQHSVSHGHEYLSFDEALDREHERLEHEEQRLLDQPDYYSFSHQHHSYTSRGIYVDQIRRWNAQVPTERTLIIQSERFYRNPAAVVNDVCRFLGLTPFTPTIDTRHNAIDYRQMEPETRQRLMIFFQPHNQRLFDHLGDQFDWDR